MLEKEIAELRRRLRLEKSTVDTLCGCYINDKKEIVTTFKQSMPAMPQEEAERYLSLLRKTLTGTVGKNLLDISFHNEQVQEGQEHQLLSTLRSSALSDEQALRQFYEKVASGLELEGNYVILLAHDVYDVPIYGKDGEKADGSETMFSYLLCAICPIKLTKPALRYDSFRSLFQSKEADQVVSSPEIGFLFPAFEDRCANLYGALYSTRSLTDSHEELANALFGGITPLPLPAATQKETFGSVLESTLQEECSLDVVQTVQDHLLARVEAQKEHEEEPLPPVTKQELHQTLQGCGVSEEKLVQFDTRYDEAFGEQATLYPQNLVNKGKLELRTEDVVVSLDAANSDLVQTRLLDGKPCIIIRAEGTLTVNGIEIKIKKEPNTL